MQTHEKRYTNPKIHFAAMVFDLKDIISSYKFCP